MVLARALESYGDRAAQVKGAGGIGPSLIGLLTMNFYHLGNAMNVRHSQTREARLGLVAPEGLEPPTLSSED